MYALVTDVQLKKFMDTLQWFKNDIPLYETIAKPFIYFWKVSTNTRDSDGGVRYLQMIYIA